ncbi:hypothetical protein TRV_01611 [Trichophyton verrucosum HKI 0517]|uniref:Uncharacterized protein n=1 Tax=Trichophyton verrucosum (strain HKI 0517) TaxID=663202 RepID=D4D3F1_TRIVH|nr:uncharacterized protein TRV_01611 [Trichophyton verrucosum HKI 0517]EFE43649.1 hypothetical protein TRV_01611 [Trichophyton verrucosum HKI 0517]
MTLRPFSFILSLCKSLLRRDGRSGAEKKKKKKKHKNKRAFFAF